MLYSLSSNAVRLSRHYIMKRGVFTNYEYPSNKNSLFDFIVDFPFAQLFGFNHSRLVSLACSFRPSSRLPVFLYPSSRHRLTSARNYYYLSIVFLPCSNFPQVPTVPPLTRPAIAIVGLRHLPLVLCSLRVSMDGLRGRSPIGESSRPHTR